MNLPVPIAENPKFHNLFLDFVKTINLRSHAYPLSDCRQFFNEILEKKKSDRWFQLSIQLLCLLQCTEILSLIFLS